MGLSVRQKKIMWYELGQRRCYCGRQLVWNDRQPNTATFEHLVPKSAGGTYHFFNCVLACSDCNHRRGNMCWIKWIKQENPPKAEWLIERYARAVAEYRRLNREVRIRQKVVNVYIENLTINNR